MEAVQIPAGPFRKSLQDSIDAQETAFPVIGVAIGHNRPRQIQFAAQQLMASETEEESRLELLRRELNLARAIVADRDANDWECRLLRVNAILNAFPERPSR